MPLLFLIQELSSICPPLFQFIKVLSYLNTCFFTSNHILISILYLLHILSSSFSLPSQTVQVIFSSLSARPHKQLSSVLFINQITTTICNPTNYIKKMEKTPRII